jgi:hypothetical protein
MAREAPSDLAGQQAALIAALTGGGEVPAGFDSSRLQAAGVALAQKRVRSAAHAWPTLFQALGDSARSLFERYAELMPLPREGGPLADGRFFVQWLSTQRKLTSGARLEIMSVDLRYAMKSTGLLARKWPSCRIALLSARRVVVAIRIPRVGEYWFG